jgi:FtsH-binding integral membrane protein
VKRIVSVCLRRRLQTPEISERKYFVALVLTTCYGLMVSVYIATYNLDWQQESWSRFVFYGVFLPIVGIYLARASDIPIVSFVGYSMRMFGLGVIIGPTFGYYHMQAILTIGVSTFVVLVMTSLAGIFKPDCVKQLRTYLVAAMVGLLCVRLAQSLSGAIGTDPNYWYVPLIECGAVTLFSLYVIYDWRKAMSLRHTADNAIDCSLGIFGGTVLMMFSLLSTIFVLVSKLFQKRNPQNSQVT